MERCLQVICGAVVLFETVEHARVFSFVSFDNGVVIFVIYVGVVAVLFVAYGVPVQHGATVLVRHDFLLWQKTFVCF